MTVPDGQDTKFSEVGNGVKVEFTGDAKIYAHDELNVWKVVTATGVQTAQVLTTDYTVEINGVDNALTTDGFKVTYVTAPLATETSLILTNYTLDQSTDLSLAGNLPEDSLEEMSDKLTLIVLQQQEEIDRCLKQDEFAAGGITFPTAVTDKGIKWDATGNFVNTDNDIDDIATDAAASAAAALASENAASTSETNAATSETNAAASAAAAAASVSSLKINKVKYSVTSVSQAVIANGGTFTGVATGNVFTFTSSRTFDITGTAGTLGSLNTGSEASNTWYYLIGLGDTTNTVTPHVIGVSESDYATFDETDLTGNYSAYDDYKRIGAVRNLGSDLILGYYDDGRFYFGQRIVASSVTATSWTDVDMSDEIPPFCNGASLLFQGSGVNQTEYRINGLTSGFELWNTIDDGSAETLVYLDDSQIFEAQVTAASTSVIPIYYLDDLSNEGQ